MRIAYNGTVWGVLSCHVDITGLLYDVRVEYTGKSLFGMVEDKFDFEKQYEFLLIIKSFVHTPHIPFLFETIFQIFSIKISEIQYLRVEQCMIPIIYIFYRKLCVTQL